ncbi:MAG: hypothetical protein JWQ96_2193 [Segetibacter sp.]|nr:hypothetical protein [Segetibacter sp.]
MRLRLCHSLVRYLFMATGGHFLKRVLARMQDDGQFAVLAFNPAVRYTALHNKRLIVAPKDDEMRRNDA